MGNNLRTAKDQLTQLGYVECPECKNYYKSGSVCACGNADVSNHQQKPATRSPRPAKPPNDSFIQSNLKFNNKGK